MARTTVQFDLNLFCFVLHFLSAFSQTFLDLEELSVQYGIEITNKPVILNSQPIDENVLHLSSKHGQLYSCFLPKLPDEQEQESNTGVPVENVTDILDKSLNETCLTHKKGWWTYKLCHKKSITQYHVSETGDVDSPITNLGSFSSEDDWSKEEVIQRKPSEIFHSQTYTNGSVCDVTKEPRKTVVQYFCSTKLSDSIIRIEEPATCEYIITVHSSKLCNHPLFFKKETKKTVNLLCSPALMEHEYNKYTEKMNKKKKKEEERMKKVLEKKKELDASGKNADGEVKGEMSSVKTEGKEMLNDIATFMKGFMNVLNIKSDDVKVTTKLYKDGKAVGNDKLNLEELQTQLNKEIEDEIAKSDSESEKNINKKDVAKPRYIGKIKKDSEDTPTELSTEKDKSKTKTETLKEFNSLTDTMIKQLEEDSIRMEKNSAKERLLMLNEFLRVRKQAVKELDKSQRMLSILESMKMDGKSEKSKKELQKQISQVKSLIENLLGQIKFIDSKRKTVAELEEKTTKRLRDINKKIISTRTAHKVAKSLEKAPKGMKSEEYLDKVFKDIFKDDEKDKIENKNKDALDKLVTDDSEKTKDILEKKDKKDADDMPFDAVFGTEEEKINANLKKSLEEIQKVASGSEERIKSNTDSSLDDDDDDTDDDEKDDLDDLDETSDEKKLSKVKNDKERSKIVSDMLKNLRSEIGKLKNDIDNNKFVKGDKKKSETDIEKEKELDEITNLKEDDEKPKNGKKGKGLDSFFSLLKDEVGKANEKFQKENTLISVVNDEEKKMAEEGKEDAKKKIEVRVRSLDGATLEKELDKTLDETDDEVKAVSKKMEETVRQQLKDAGLDFGNKLKIKIITTKDKFDKFGDGKDVKLLNDEDATDFKDLLLGFLGGGKEKVNEEQRQKTLETNYNFRLDDEEEESLSDNIL